MDHESRKINITIPLGWDINTQRTCGEVVDIVCAYVKEHNLQEEIIRDDALTKLIKVEERKIPFPQLQKHIDENTSKLLVNPETVAARIADSIAEIDTELGIRRDLVHASALSYAHATELITELSADVDRVSC